MHKNDFHQGPSTTPVLRRGCRHRRRNIAHRLRKLGVWEKKLALSKSCPTKITKDKIEASAKKQKLVAKQFYKCFAPMECVHQISFQLDGPRRHWKKRVKPC